MALERVGGLPPARPCLSSLGGNAWRPSGETQRSKTPASHRDFERDRLDPDWVETAVVGSKGLARVPKRGRFDRVARCLTLLFWEGMRWRRFCGVGETFGLGRMF